MQKLLILLSLLCFTIIIVLACGSDSNPVAITEHDHDISDLPEHEHTTPVGDAISQLLNMNQPDILFNTIFTNNDSGIVSFQTSSEFRFKGASNTLISVVRAVEISHQNQTQQGTIAQFFGVAIGTIVNSDGIEVSTLNPSQTYYYLVTWPDTNPFPLVLEDGSVAVYTNFYTLSDSTGSSVSKRGAGQLPFSPGSYRKLQ